MDHDRTDIPGITCIALLLLQRPVRGLQLVQILLAGHIPVTMGQQLHFICFRLQDAGQYLLIGKRAVPFIISRLVPPFHLLIWFPHPGRPALGGSVQEHLIAPKFYMVLVTFHIILHGLCHCIAFPDIGICHQIQFQQAGPFQHPVKRQKLCRQHSFLDRGDAVGCIQLLGAAIGFQKRLGRWHWNLILILQESTFLHISGGNPILRFNESALG